MGNVGPGAVLFFATLHVKSFFGKSYFQRDLY